MKNEQLPLLIVEDDPELSARLRGFLNGQGREVRWEKVAEAGQALESSNGFALILLSYPALEGREELMRSLRTACPEAPIVVMLDEPDGEIAAEAIRQGAASLIFKPIKERELSERVERLINQSERVGSQLASGSPGLVGRSEAFLEARRILELAAPSGVMILLSGETGTGKKVMARLVHNSSPRRRGPFVTVHCGGLSEQFLADELFGHVRGAFSDAGADRVGKLEQASGGTLLLDEVGELPQSLQQKLLDVMERQEMERLGGDRLISVDIRFVAATSVDLEEKVAAGEFQPDLFYRLNGVPVHLSALRQRKEDIPVLVEHFLTHIGLEQGSRPKRLSAEALQAMTQFPWPGNIRQLENAVEFAHVMSGSRLEILPQDLPGWMQSPRFMLPEEMLKLELPEHGMDLIAFLSGLERKLIQDSLERTGGNRMQAARLLSLKRTTLVEKIRRMEICA